jgi:hypothetical protein
MTEWVPGVEAHDGQAVPPALMRKALTAGVLLFGDGASQVFEPDGGTTYVEGGRRTRGEWRTDDDGSFASFWPPRYRASYGLRWIVDDGVIVGLRFVDLGGGGAFDGRYVG